MGGYSSLSVLLIFFMGALLGAVSIGVGERLKKKKKSLSSANNVVTNSKTQFSGPSPKKCSLESHSGKDGIAWRFSRC